MDLLRDVLDNQLVDRNGIRMGKVDGLVAELRDGAPPRLAFVEIGAVALARRLGPRAGRWVAGLWARLGGERAREPHRVPWSKVRDVGLDVDLDLDVEETSVNDWQDWLRNRVIDRIPGA